MAPPDLTPFGFTPTESLAYLTLLRLGPSTGYAVARAARLARANAYGALEGLALRGAAGPSGYGAGGGARPSHARVAQLLAPVHARDARGRRQPGSRELDSTAR